MNRTAFWMAIVGALTLIHAGWSAQPGRSGRVRPLVLDLVDGSRLVGVLGIRSLPVKTPVIETDIPLQRIVCVTLEDDQGTAFIELANGDSLKGVVKLKSLKVESSVGSISVGLEQVWKVQQAVRSYPEHRNVALASRDATVKAEQGADALNDGNKTVYDSLTGFAHGSWPCNFLLEFPKARNIGTIRFLLWDGDDRSYRYRVETSVDGKAWKSLADHSAEGQRGWQEIQFEPRSVKYVKVRGLHNSANRDFHIVEIEAFAGNAAKDSWKPVKEMPKRFAVADAGPDFNRGRDDVRR